VSLARPSRRQVVVAVPGAAGLALLVAACGSGSSGSQAGAGGDGGGGSLQLSAVPVGSAVAAKDASGKPVVVARPAQDRVVAFSAVCTHMGCTVAPAGTTLKCPCHGSAFDATTGAVLNGPASRPLPSVSVRVDGGSVVLG
jgi:cytochrome b6-f complex iron-sulfur subunit